MPLPAGSRSLRCAAGPPPTFPLHSTNASSRGVQRYCTPQRPAFHRPCSPSRVSHLTPPHPTPPHPQTRMHTTSTPPRRAPSPHSPPGMPAPAGGPCPLTAHPAPRTALPPAAGPAHRGRHRAATPESGSRAGRSRCCRLQGGWVGGWVGGCTRGCRHACSPMHIHRETPVRSLV